MSRSSLSRFTVPLSGNQSASTQGLLMPKLPFRFRAVFLDFGVSQDRTELTKQVVSFARPQVNFDPIEIPVYNSKVYLAGRPTWQAVSCVMRDDAQGNISRLVGEQLQRQFDFMEQATPSAGINYKFQVNIEMLDGNNGATEAQVLERWELYGCFLTDVNYNEASYASNDPLQITMSIRYDNAIQTAGGGVGTAVSRGTGSVITG